MPFQELRGIRVHYQQAGSGPDVVLVHAFTSNLAVWMLTDIVPVLSQDFRVTCYDLRGHGATQVTRTGYDSHTLAQDLLELCRFLQLGPAAFVGHSYGGVIATHATLLNPGLATCLILCDTFFPGLAALEPQMRSALVWGDLRETFARSGLELPAEVDFTALFQLLAALDEAGIAALKGQLPPPAMRWLLQTKQLATTQAGSEMFLEAGLDQATLKQLACPFVALYDEQTPFAATRDYLRSNFPQCTVDEIPGANHLGPVQNSPEFVRRVAGHLKRRLLAH